MRGGWRGMHNPIDGLRKGTSLQLPRKLDGVLVTSLPTSRAHAEELRDVP